MKRRLVNGLRRGAALLAIACCLCPRTVQAEDTQAAGGEEALPAASSYTAYRQRHTDLPFTGQTVEADISQASGSEETQLQNGAYGAEGPVVVTGETGYADFPVEIPADGLYSLRIAYYPLPGSGESIERDILIDGAVPFDEAEAIAFSRVWKDAGGIERDTDGNEVRPGQTEVSSWREAYAADYFGYYGEALYFAFTQGTHTIRLRAVSEPMAIRAVTLESLDRTPPAYAEKLQEWKEAGLEPVAGFSETGYLVQEAEAAYEKSDPTLFPACDRTSAATQPFDAVKTRLNMIGGTNWQSPGQWITWEIEAPAEGLYQIALRSRQNFVRGQYVKRAIYINGEIPFQEAGDLTFNYSDSWTVAPLGGDTPYLFHLKEGRNTLTMKVTLGDLEQVLGRAQACLSQLNDAYFQLLTVLGTEPDPYRDYKIDVYQPEVLAIFRAQKDELEAIAAEYEGKTGQRADQTATLHELAYQLSQMTDNPRKIVEIFSSFKDNIGAFASWITSAMQQPLQLDYLLLAEEGASLPEAEKGFFANLKYQIILFLSSFVTDYSAVSGQDKDAASSITVWIGSGVTGGRDQAQILRGLVSNSFTPAFQIGVNLQLISTGTLLPATLAGKGPDVALQIGGSDPVNYAMRKAVVDLSEYPGFDEVKERFAPSALEPFSYTNNGHTGVYAIPETQVFPILFYRSDILERLGIDIEKLQTWEDIAGIFPILGKNHMQFGLPANINSFGTFLYQNGGSFYKNEGRQSDLDSTVSLESFRQWCDYYISYGVPLTYSFENRFRTGEMPIGIADYTTYNLLSVSAPEIRGQWGIAPVPGTRREDGTIDNTVASTSAGAILMANARDKDASWEFIRWWTSADVQVQFGKELESVIGTAARYNTANREALQRLPWPAADRAVLNAQWDATRGIPEVPGGYQTSRYLDFALRDVVVSNAEARITLMDNVAPINDEIEAQRKELGLD